MKEAGERVLTLKSLDSSFSKRHGQIQGNVVLMVANHSKELKPKLIQSLKRKTPHHFQSMIPEQYFLFLTLAAVKEIPWDLLA